MSDSDNPVNVYETTKAAIGYIPRQMAPQSLYEALGFRCGLEVHQQLKTEKKLFCRCPARQYQDGEAYDAQLVRHMRPTLSELGEYDGTALMEFKTKKNIIYRIKGETACTYDIDDTPPFVINRDALAIATEIALLLGSQLVGELHIARKQYLDGSIPTGFQRTAIVGIDGEIQLTNKIVRIIQLSIEEDSCREVSDIGHERTYSTDRLGMPLIETVTYPDLLTPDEAAEAAQQIRYLNRSTGHVRVGIGAGREDVNVSIEGGTRVEIKGVQHIRWIPELTHNEAFRQKALLAIRSQLKTNVSDPASWTLTAVALDPKAYAIAAAEERDPEALVAMNLPGFAGILSFFTSPNRCFADELADRVKVIACIEKPNLAHCEELHSKLDEQAWNRIRAALSSSDADAQIIVWGPRRDMAMAIETVEERCKMAFEGVPNETRKALVDGTTLFERVLPGADRMYPDTDSAPIPIDESDIEEIRAALPKSISDCISQMLEWHIPADCQPFILKRALFPLLAKLIIEQGIDPIFAGTLLGHSLRAACGDRPGDGQWILSLVAEIRRRNLNVELIKTLLPIASVHPQAIVDDLLHQIGYAPYSEREILDQIPLLLAAFSQRRRRNPAHAQRNWVMGRLRPQALGNMSLAALAHRVEEGGVR
ncbi:Glu-tRNA(Gln) amidotransferase subunit GatE [Candidatus Bipolaricaulota bacterium]|nr:Glu-tRNA(Gln) amidotransferase subunit GatE [Candidatus Bipolaricaulota bacterium]